MGILITNFRNGDVIVSSLSGVTPSQIGGPLRRESSTGAGIGAVYRHENNRAINFQGGLYVIHASAIAACRIYKFDGDAFSTGISGLSGLFTLGETINGQTSSATAIIADASISGDDFIIIKTISGTFQAGESILGAASSASAVIGAIPAQGGAASLEGEWVLEYALTQTLDNVLGHSGLYSTNSGGKNVITGIFSTSAHYTCSFTFDPDENKWTEFLNLLYNGTAGAEEYGKGQFLDDSLWINFENNASSSGDHHDYIQFNEAAKSTINNTISNHIGWNPQRNSFGMDIVNFNGNYFTWEWPSNVNDSIQLREIGGQGSVFSPGNSSGETNRPVQLATSNRGGSLFYVLNDIMYAYYYSAAITGWVCGRFHFDSGEDLICSTLASSGYTNNDIFSDFYFTTGFGLRSGLSTANARWRGILDKETNDPDGTTRMLLYHVTNPTAGTTRGLVHTGIINLTNGTYTWDGTTTVNVSADPTLGPDSIVVGDWIGIRSDKRIYEVSGTSSSTVTIVDNFTLGIPSGISTSVKETALTNVGTDTTISESAFSEDRVSIGDRSFIKGGVTISIVGTVPNETGTRIYFKCFSDSGSAGATAEFFYGPDFRDSEPSSGQPNSTCTLSDASSGTINSVNEITGLTADNTTEYEVTWVHSSDGVLHNEQRILIPKVT